MVNSHFKKRFIALGLLNKGLISVGTDPESAALKSAPIHWYHPRNQISGRRFILVGDAAGVDVLFGEGISPALGYGKIASLEIANAFRTDDFSFKSYRNNWCSIGLLDVFVQTKK